MSYATIEDRVDRLEALFGQFLTKMTILARRADEREQSALEREQAAEKRHQAAEERMARFEKLTEERNQAAEERLARFAAEMSEFKDEMRTFKDEMRQSKRELDKKWGDLANKLGTIVEDILAPNLRRLAREHFGFETILAFMIRCTRRRPEQPEIEVEFDTVVAGPEAVIVGEAKSKPTRDAAEQFAQKLGAFGDFFPEYQGRRVIPVFGSWAIPEPVIERLTALRIYAMRMGEDTMELANAAALEGEGRQR